MREPRVQHPAWRCINWAFRLTQIPIPLSLAHHSFTDAQVLSPDFLTQVGDIVSVMSPLVLLLNDMMHPASEHEEEVEEEEEEDEESEPDEGEKAEVTVEEEEPVEEELEEEDEEAEDGAGGGIEAV